MKKETAKKTPAKKTPAKKAVAKITPQQFKNITNDLRDAINDHIKNNEMSPHAFAKKCKIHPTQLYLFLKGDRGLNLPSVEKIADVISQ